MEKKRFIFDLDRTLLTCNYRLVETAVFEPIFREDTEYLISITSISLSKNLLISFSKSHSS